MSLLPLSSSIPGASGNVRSNFHCPHHFEYLDGVCLLTDKTDYEEAEEKQCCSNYVDSCKLPSWVLYDKHILTFEAVFEEPMLDTYQNKQVVRKVKILYFLEDGTIKVVEPKILNCGIPQGCLIARQRIPHPQSHDKKFVYGISDLNIGKTVNFFQRKFTIVSCDNFTRNFLIRYGIPVPPSISTFLNQYNTSSNKEILSQEKPAEVKHYKVKQFLEFDRKVLLFRGYWDDRKTEKGTVHYFELLYFLADNTIEMYEIFPELKNKRKCFLHRSQLPKKGHDFSQVGTDSNLTVLNVLGANIQKSRFLYDVLNCGKLNIEYYSETDLRIGAAIAVYGRNIILYDCDTFTKEYFKHKYGIEDFSPIQPPETDEYASRQIRNTGYQLPPYNGFGSLEDSALNCTLKTEIKPSTVAKHITNDYKGDQFLKFSAKILTSSGIDDIRQFVITYYLDSQKVDIFEKASENSGFCGGMFYSSRRILKPNQEKFTSKFPEYYESNDFFIGNIIVVEGFRFFITGADSFSLKYMEEHCKDFPLSNISLVLGKVKSVFTSIFRDFLSKYSMNRTEKYLSFHQFRQAIKEYMGDKLTEHEILTLARHYKVQEQQNEAEYLNYLRIDILNDLKRFLFNDFERIAEQFSHRDKDKTGKVSKEVAYAVLRGAHIPLSQDMIKSLLNSLVGSDGLIKYNYLLQFIDYKKNPLMASQNTDDLKTEYSSHKIRSDKSWQINLEEFITDLDLGHLYNNS